MNNTLQIAKELDKADDLSKYRNRFHIPKTKEGKDQIYFCGNSLGLMPISATKYIQDELDDWKNLAVDGHFNAKNPWWCYNDFLASEMADIVGALPSEIVIMNSLTVNLHLMMASFYKPSQHRFKILVDFSLFPSDRYAIASQLKFHGYDVESGIIELKPSKGEFLISTEEIKDVIEKQGDEIALILIGGVNYYTGQVYDIKEITRLGHQKGCMVGFDLAHATGNISLNLHEDGPDFAAWCTYKYMNAGPGSLSGCFIHERHHNNPTLDRFAGWYGHERKTRFLMGNDFIPINSAEGWQLSNPPIIQLAAIKASLDIFKEVTMESLAAKSNKLTAYLYYLINSDDNHSVKIITPKTPDQRGCQLSIQMKTPDKRLFQYLGENGIRVDWREPDVIRVAPVPLYNSFEEVWNFNRILKEGIKKLNL